jgi:hypothetical protein
MDFYDLEFTFVNLSKKKQLKTIKFAFKKISEKPFNLKV